MFRRLMKILKDSCILLLKNKVVFFATVIFIASLTQIEFKGYIFTNVIRYIHGSNEVPLLLKAMAFLIYCLIGFSSITTLFRMTFFSKKSFSDFMFDLKTHILHYIMVVFLVYVPLSIIIDYLYFISNKNSFGPMRFITGSLLFMFKYTIVFICAIFGVEGCSNRGKVFKKIFTKICVSFCILILATIVIYPFVNEVVKLIFHEDKTLVPFTLNLVQNNKCDLWKSRSILLFQSILTPFIFTYIYLNYKRVLK